VRRLAHRPGNIADLALVAGQSALYPKERASHGDLELHAVAPVAASATRSA
jgi:hypothetical protein